ncbi:ROK family protein [Geothrix sp. PMB-07]|uniref:ROK family protein n=1 Tax=Geothrix sp. PMB-07 TaxID=3068640 RepID=UPI002740FEDA|nr:ROK family protein [Geothrix sp. PMB-07]WLT33464.1 ROK family protein [Geothrix sp. PMB-07]
MESKTLIGVDLGGTNMRVGRIEDGQVVALASRSTPATAPEEAVLEALAALIAEVFTPNVSAIGVGVPSVVDETLGIVYHVENIPSWQEVHLGEFLMRRFDRPVFVNNDANCFAVGEFHFGLGQGFRHMIGMVVGTGLGAGVIMNGQLYTGSNCGAGELGTMPYRDHTFEHYASGQTFERDFGLAGSVVHSRAMKGDPKALEILTAFGRDFGQVIMATLYAFDPELIVLGGSVSKAFPFFETGMRQTLGGYAYQHALRRLLIRVSEEPHIAVLGAAALCLEAQHISALRS